MRGSISPDARHERFELCTLVRRTAEEELDRRGFRGERSFRCAGSRPGSGAGQGVGEIEVEMVRSALCHILANLIANAVDATAATRGARIAVEAAEAGSGVRITVRDNGPGVDAHAVARLGEPFHTTKADRGGTGLGLYVSNLLAERMGGALHLETGPGRGTEVTLWLPRDGHTPDKVRVLRPGAAGAGAATRAGEADPHLGRVTP